MTSAFSPWRFCTAPCMDWTDRHCRYFWRLLSRHARVYTEMVTTGALLHGDQAKHLDFSGAEHPVALQLGGSNPMDLAECAALGASWGYDEINLNCGCPSDRVQNGRFGACLMEEPELVRDCIAAMTARVNIPVTVKHRIGIDQQESYGELQHFVETVSHGGAQVFIVHARKAWLTGLSPKENREIPPLNYDWVYRLKRDFPHLTFVLNGGITSIDQSIAALNQIDGVMLGRAAYQNPWLLASVDPRLFGDERPVDSRHAVIERLLPYVRAQLANGVRLNHISRHVLGLFSGRPGGKKFRRHLSEGAHRPDASAQTLLDAASLCAQSQENPSPVEPALGVTA